MREIPPEIIESFDELKAMTPFIYVFLVFISSITVIKIFNIKNIRFEALTALIFAIVLAGFTMYAFPDKFSGKMGLASLVIGFILSITLVIFRKNILSWRKNSNIGKKV